MTFREWWAAFIGADFYTKVEVAENAWMARDSWANIAEAQSAAEIAGLRAKDAGESTTIKPTHWRETA